MCQNKRNEISMSSDDSCFQDISYVSLKCILKCILPVMKIIKVIFYYINISTSQNQIRDNTIFPNATCSQNILYVSIIIDIK